MIQAEDITREFDFFRSYDDLLVFETDLAQIVELIILFCESEGSLAELGAFSMIEDIMKRLFVVVSEKHWNEPSFVKLGPLRRIEREVGREAIHVVADDDVGIEGRITRNIDKNKLIELLEAPLEQRLHVIREPTTFDRERPGHIIKLIVGLVQEYGAITMQEISQFLKFLGAEKRDDQIRGYARCGIAVNWLTIISKGGRDYYVQTRASIEKGEDAATLPMKKGVGEANKQRRRAAIREYWREKDKLRFAAIQQASREIQYG